jgi:methionyl-tRNA synthetase
MVSGSDVHGTPITVRADQEGVEPQVIVDRYHAEFLSNWKQLGISFDLYTSTGTPNHFAVTQDVFRHLRDNGYLATKESEQLFDPEADRFLPDRYVEGKCPHCGYAEARGDQCENCGRQLDPMDLIEPRSRLTGASPVVRTTLHYYLLLSRFQKRLLDWLKSRQGWRRHVLRMAIGFTEEGLQDRAITRDLTWGVPIPEESDTIGEGKRIYVWFDAVIGYLSAAKEWAAMKGTPEAWRDWWENPEAASYYFIGKDNIVFHAVIWPCQLMGYGGLNLPTDIPANQFITFKGDKASASRGVGRSVGWYAERLEPDALRFALAANLPEQNDTDLADGDIIRRINEELVSTWGNLVNRVLTITSRNFEHRIPEPGPLSQIDEEVIAAIDTALNRVGELISEVELRAGLRTAMEAATAVNVYLNSTEPWKLVNTDRDRAATVLYTASAAISGLAVVFTPYLPFTSPQVGEMLGTGPVDEWSRPKLTPGTKLGEIAPLFQKISDDILNEDA